jgi:hypothetical protein
VAIERNPLLRLAEATRGLPQQQQALAEVAFALPIDEETRGALVRIGRFSRLSLGAFLKDPRWHAHANRTMGLDRLAEAISAWLVRVNPRLQLSPSEKAATADRAGQSGGLRKLLDASRIPDIDSWPALVLDPEGHLEDLADYTLHTSLGALADAPLRYADRSELPILEGAARAFFAEVEDARAEERKRPALLERLVPTGDDALDRVLRTACIARQATLEAWPRGLLPSTTQAHGIEDKLRFTVQVLGANQPFVVTPPPLPEWGVKTSLACSCGKAACVHRAVALDAFLETMQAPDGRLREVVRRGLAPTWQRALDEFLEFEKEGARPAKRDQPGALSFHFSQHDVELRLHTLGKKGKSKSGVRLYQPAAALHRVSGLDRRILELLALGEVDGRTDSPLFGDGLLLLAGHPACHWEGSEKPVPVEVVEARAVAEESAAGLRFRFFAGDRELALERAGGFLCTGGRLLTDFHQGRLQLTRLPEKLLQFATALVRNGAAFPREALPQLAELLPRLEAVAAVELPEELRGEEHPSRNRPAVRVEQASGALQLSLRIEPIAAGPLFSPGQGVTMAVALEGHRRVFARRELEREVAEANAVAGQLGLDPALAEQAYTWRLPEGERGIETLRRLHLAAAQGLWVEWKAPKPRFTSEAQLGKVRLVVERKRDWFGLDGEVVVDGTRIRLAALLEAARLRRRWVKLGEGDYALIEEQLLEKLAPLAHLAETDKPAQLTLGTVPLVDALAPFVEDLKADEGYRALLDRLSRARAFEPSLPKALTAELRDYQLDGFRWLSRLAEWGAGAVLADDMGLGKTLQALALLVSRAALGPALVVAPASVLHGWRSEAARFAPTLRVHLFHESDRALGALGPGDVVAVSWSLLAREAALFAGTPFATAVLDEAQAIKNASTLRARSAHGLQAEFVVALSGTPIENHLGELWSLLRAVLPSLLGSEESFRRRFGANAANPKEAAKALALLAQPFLLRRTKGEVALELPPRTDIDVLVPLSPEERALYDDVRLAATADLGELTADDQRFRVLAALNRLRLAACHPRLVQAEWDGPTSKLTRLLELARDLVAAGHRAQVFSQFTSHLALVADALRSEGLSFSYLDGQVPLAERQRRVEQFQAGDGGDLFLISLKAGGTGLNLTAADYVIHLDPWWNPAVEDQASDRAHRIGQERPVTVYRLIAEGSVEQQILSLHREKRELVDAFLAGADRAGKLSAAQLAELIRGGK